LIISDIANHNIEHLSILKDIKINISIILNASVIFPVDSLVFFVTSILVEESLLSLSVPLLELLVIIPTLTTYLRTVIYFSIVYVVLIHLAIQKQLLSMIYQILFFKLYFLLLY